MASVAESGITVAPDDPGGEGTVATSESKNAQPETKPANSAVTASLASVWRVTRSPTFRSVKPKAVRADAEGDLSRILAVNRTVRTDVPGRGGSQRIVWIAPADNRLNYYD